MVKFMVKASELKNVCKAVNDRKLAELKKEIIEILKKQDEKDFKKATDYLNSQEEHFTHLEESLSGKWIEKAGYGIGTVRVWKGKKYKKIAPDKWVRVFDKEGRGTNIKIGKLIAKVNKIDNVEDLMAFVMANKQRFVDENGVDLPVLDKLRAAVDARNGNVGNKGTSKIENTTLKYDDNGKIKEVESTLIEPSKTARNFKYNKDKLSIDELKDAKNEIDSYIQKLNKEISSLEKIKKENADKLTDNAKANIDGNIAYSKNIINAYTKDKADCEKLLEEKNNKPDEKKIVQGVKILSKDEIHNLTKGEVQDYRKELHDAMKKLDYGDSDFDILHETKKIADDTWNNKEYKGAVDSDKNIKEFAAFLKENNLHQHDKIEYKGKEYIVQYDSQDGDGDLLWIPPVFDDSEFDVKEITIKTKDKEDVDPRTGKENYWIQDSRGNRLTNKDAIKRIQDNLARIDELENSDEPRKDMKIKDLKFDNEYLRDRLNSDDRKESEAEKHQNRSEAMKGNKNAVKVGGEKDVIGTFTKSADGSVEMPATKENVALFDSLKKSTSKDEKRPFMTDCYYDGENIISTDGYRLVCIKAGDVGLPEGYVRVNTDDGKIKLEHDAEKTKEEHFPNYKRVISKAEDNNQEVKLDNKALKDKLKEMKKEGAYTKGKPKVTFEFENGKVLLDGTVVGTGNVDFGDEEKFINFNAQYLTDAALSGDNASMFISDDPNNAVSISTNTSDTLIMPIITGKGKADYSENRAAKEKEKSEKAEKLSKNRERNESLIKESIKDIDGQVERVYSNVDNKISRFSDEELKRNYDILNLNMDKIMDRSVDFPSKVVDKKTNASFAMAYAYSKLKEKHPDVKDKFLAELEKRGISVKKSLFDDILFIETVDEDIDDMEEDQEEESLFNDYSAEQPELFNSTEFQVREALNRRFNCR